MARNSETPGNPGSLTRRTFLRDSIGAITGVALLSPAVVPASVFGANAPSNRVTVGMIGMGRQAYYSNVKSFLSFPDVQVIAVCDVDAWRLENGRNAVEQHYAKGQPSGVFRGCIGYRDFRDLLERTDIDAVKTRGQTLADAEVGHRTTSLCQLGHIAVQMGRKLTWNPEKERFVNDDAANRLIFWPLWCLSLQQAVPRFVGPRTLCPTCGSCLFPKGHQSHGFRRYRWCVLHRDHRAVT